MRSATLYSSPSAVSRSFAQALSGGDLEGATAHFLVDGCLITPDATALHGRESIRPLLTQLILAGVGIGIELSSAVGGGGIALISERWTIRARAAADRSPVLTTTSTTVLHHDGRHWRLAIAAPWGYGHERL